MKRWALLASSVGLFSMGTLGSAAQAQSDPVRASIEATLARYVDALKRGDATGAASIFATDSTLLVPGKFIQGHDAILAFFTARLQARKYLDGALTTVSVDVNGDLAQELAGQPAAAVTGH